MRRHTVLIVDDDSASVEAVALALGADARLDLVTAANGSLAWDWLEAHSAAPPSAIVTDLQMPLLDGFGLIRMVREQACYDRVAIIVISASADPGARDRTLALGADDYFVKPWSPVRLKRRLEELLYDSNGQPAPR